MLGIIGIPEVHFHSTPSRANSSHIIVHDILAKKNIMKNDYNFYKCTLHPITRLGNTSLNLQPIILEMILYSTLQRYMDLNCIISSQVIHI